MAPYIPGFLIVAAILYTFGRCCIAYGERKGFANGCRSERRFNANRMILASRNKGASRN